MKYSNTARVLSFVFHLILVLAFGVLGFYFGFFVVPEYFDATIRPNFINDVIAGYPLDLVIELAVLGLSIFTISLYGLVNGIKSLLNPSDDKPVVKSFVAFIGDGYVASIFFAACAFLYFDPIANKNMAFAIVMCVLLMIILLIATNIPMYHLFEGKETSQELMGLSFSAAVGFGYIALMNVLALVSSLVVMSRSSYSYDFNFNMQLIAAAVSAAVVAGLMLASGLIIKKKGVADKKGVALSGYLASGAFFALGAGLLSTGIMELIWRSYPCHLVSYDFAFTGFGYGVMCLVIGSLAIIGSVVFVVVTYQDSQKKTVKA